MRLGDDQYYHPLGHTTSISSDVADHITQDGARSNIAYVLLAIGIAGILVAPIFSRSSHMA
jgi:hypothetical protein